MDGSNPSVWRAVLAALQSDYASLGLAGISGAIAAAIADWRGWAQLLRKAVVGAICAVYISPLAVPMLQFFLPGIGVPEDRAPELGGFLMGMLGIVLVEFLLHVVSVRRQLLEGERRAAQIRPATPYNEAPAAVEANLDPPPQEKDL